ncbi:hypothetical protein [Hymenobacter guriensis]|uniref:Nuclear transport factor 2 family protein n=1 Tax=Hymenobacter guriensis TaxID=2793065 RepID=A0ABS0L601_9BACT|nr:hypothetical protein [Hymenobacter guriensis]MBG8555556.1 hypothetical protein [Hymenobacter guriensis]
MKHLKLTALTTLVVFGCGQANHKTSLIKEEKLSNTTNDITTSAKADTLSAATDESSFSVKEGTPPVLTDEEKQIKHLIRNVLNWADANKSINLLPVISDTKDSVYVGFDLVKHKQNLTKLRQTTFFSKEFIENYNKIILTLDKELRSGKEKWLVGDMPTFDFASDTDPWTLSQDVPYDEPNPYDFVEIKIINLDKGEVDWKWGKLESNSDIGWKNFSYRFRVVKEENKWKIAYLQGFDLK